MKKLGFTLAEVLVALGVMSVISTFTLSKVVTAHQVTVKKAIFKETLSALESTLNLLRMEGSLVFHPAGFTPFNPNNLLLKMSALKTCTTNPLVNGCITGDYPSWTHGFVLANGAQVAIKTGWYIDIAIDYNGAEGPNIRGEDQLIVYYNDLEYSFAGRRPGRMSATSSDWPGIDNYTLYDSLY